MKKFTLILSAVLLSLNVMAVNVNTTAAKLDVVKQDVRVKAVTEANVSSKAISTKTIDTKQLPAAKTTVAGAVKGIEAKKAIRRVARQTAASTGTVKEVGAGIAQLDVEWEEGVEDLYYEIGVCTAEDYLIVAQMAYYKQTTVVNATLTNSYYLLYYSASNGYVGTDYQGSTILPVGEYIYYAFGYKLDETGQYVDDSEAIDQIWVPFEIALTPETNAITDLKIEVSADRIVTLTWDIASGELPEGAVFQARIFDMPAEETVADSGEITEKTFTTTEALNDNATYNVYISIWSADGWSLGTPADEYFTIGTDPNAPTGLRVQVDNEAMTATFSFNSNVLTYDDTRVYNRVLIKDEAGNTYNLSSGYNNYAAQETRSTLTSEQLPVGKFTWSVQPFYVPENSWLFISSAQGEDFEIKDVTAPVINGVEVALTKGTEVALAIDVTDNAVNVEPEDLLFTVTGDITLNDVELNEEGFLVLSDLETKSYSIQIVATDPSGNSSDAFDFQFVPVEDAQAPTNLKASILNVYDKYVVVEVSAEDDIAAAEQLVYIVNIDNEVRELKAVGDSIIIDGLIPETKYNIVVKVRDFGGNISEEAVELEFTTVALIPIEIDFASFQAEWDEEYLAYTFLAYGPSTVGYMPQLYLDIYPEEKTALTGHYSEENGNLQNRYSLYYFKNEANQNQRMNITEAEVYIKYLQPYATQSGTYDLYYAEGQFMGEDGNLYIFSIAALPYIYEGDVEIEMVEEFTDTDSPLLWLDETEPVTVTGTDVDVLFGVYDGPFWPDYTKTTATNIVYLATEVYTEIENLILTVVAEDGETVLASVEDGTIEYTPTLDENGDFMFTAHLTGLQDNTVYNVTIVAKDEAENVSKLPVSFKVGEPTGLRNVFVEGEAAKKVILNGQLYIIKGNEIFNAQGARVE